MECFVRWSSGALGSATGLILLSAFCTPAFAQDLSKKADNVSSMSGAEVYMQARCFACHGEQGFGGVGPRFRQDHFLAPPDYVIGQILIGRGIMPSFAETLNDEQIAAVATYIRNSWGNNYGEVKAEQVAATRKELKKLKEKMPQQPHVSAGQSEQPHDVPMPPPGGQPPGRPLPPSDLR